MRLLMTFEQSWIAERPDLPSLLIRSMASIYTHSKSDIYHAAFWHYGNLYGTLAHVWQTYLVWKEQ